MIFLNRKSLLILLSTTLILCSSKAQNKQSKDDVHLFSYFKGNGDGLHLAYSTDGYNWKALKNDSIFLKPTAGKDMLMRDPCVIKGADGLFHMVWTVSWKEKGIGYASSKDLIHWSVQKYIPVMEHEVNALNTWAPEITYDGKKSEYMIYWSSTIKEQNADPQVKDEKSNRHRLYYVTTKDFKTFSSTKLLYDPGFSVIDASIVKDKDQYVMFLKNETETPPQKNLRIATSNKLIGPYTPAGPSITGAYWAEGPTVLRLEKTWIVYFDKYREHKMGAIKSDDLNLWTDVSEQISFPKGMRHGTIFKVSKEEFDKLK